MKLIELFPEISLNPSSAKDIKQWILQLAVEGKLTKNIRDSGIFSKPIFLDENFKKKRTDLLKNRKVKLPKIQENSFIKDMKFDIPECWNWYNFPDVVFFQEGPGIRKWQFRDEGVKLLNVQNIVGDYLNIDNSDKFIDSIEFNEKYKHFQIELGDLIFASSGGSWGKSAWFKGHNLKVMLNTSVIRLKFYDLSWASEYLKIFISSQFFKEQMNHQLVGMQPNFGSSHLSKIYIPIPPLEEQQAIVTIVEDLFKEVDALAQQATERIALKRSYAQAALKRLCEADTAKEWQQIVSVFPEIFNDKQTIKTLRETILQLAVQGKLTAKWRSKEGDKQTAHELLAQIKAVKAQLIKDKKIKAEKPLPAIEADEIPFDLPEGWVWCRLGEVGTINPRNHKNDDLDAAFIPMKDISQTFNSYPNFEIRKWKEIKSGFTHFQNEDVAFAKITPCFENSKAAIFKKLPNGFGAGTTELFVFRPLLKIISSDFTYLIFKTPTFLVYGESRMTGSAGQKRVPRSFLEEYLIGLPSILEQQIIVEKVNALMGLCDELEKEVEGKENILQKI